MCARTNLTLGLAWSSVWDSEKELNTLRLNQKPRKSDRQDRGVLIRTLKGNRISKHRQENVDFYERTQSLLSIGKKKGKLSTRSQCFSRLENHDNKRVLKDGKIKTRRKIVNTERRGRKEKRKKLARYGFSDKRLLPKPLHLLYFLFTNYYKDVKINVQFFLVKKRNHLIYLSGK